MTRSQMQIEIEHLSDFLRHTPDTAKSGGRTAAIMRAHSRRKSPRLLDYVPDRREAAIVEGAICNDAVVVSLKLL